jgi:hypothetical protein
MVAQHRGALGEVGLLDAQALADRLEDARTTGMHGPAGDVRRSQPAWSEQFPDDVDDVALEHLGNPRRQAIRNP